MAPSFPDEFFVSFIPDDHQTLSGCDELMDIESFHIHFTDDGDEFHEPMEDIPPLINDLFGDVFETALDEEMNIIPGIFLEICDNPKYEEFRSSYSSNRLLEMVQEILDEYM